MSKSSLKENQASRKQQLVNNLITALEQEFEDRHYNIDLVMKSFNYSEQVQHHLQQAVLYLGFEDTIEQCQSFLHQLHKRVLN